MGWEKSAAGSGGADSAVVRPWGRRSSAAGFRYSVVLLLGRSSAAEQGGTDRAVFKTYHLSNYLTCELYCLVMF